MRHIKPQAALIATARTQIGATPMLAISIGVGFRLSDPTILVHEAAVWEALKAATPSVPLAEVAMPKRCAEWLLAGESVHRITAADHRGMVEWNASVELDGVRKTVSCRVKANPGSAPDAFARLTIDPVQAAAGGAGENPFGIVSGTAPLQRVGVLGVAPEPLAAMGALANDWPERRQWMPARPGTSEAMARDGTHMGWPASVDLRFFQQAAPDQWSHRESWTPGARFELRGFGEHGAGYSGLLPRLAAVALVTRTDRTGADQLALRQQTLWFLPDRDIGVLWWNGAIATAYVLDDSPAMLVAAFKDAEEPFDVDTLMAFAGQRVDLSCIDPTQQADHPLMPSVDRGWSWDLILDADDHPRFSPVPYHRKEVRTRLEGQLMSLTVAREDQIRLNASGEKMQSGTLPAPPPDGQDWRQRLSVADAAGLARVTIRGADLSALRLDGWCFEEVRFERCRFDQSNWLNCSLSQVQMVDCTCVDAAFNEVQWQDGALIRCELARSSWNNVTLERVNLETCRLDDFTATAGAWSMVVVQGGGGARGCIQDVEWQGVSWNDVDACHWTWNQVRAKGIDLVECKLTDLKLSQCTMTKLSVLLSNLCRSTWQQTTLSSAVLSYGSSLEHAHLTDCVFRSSSFQDLQALGVQVNHCSFIKFNGQHLKAERSNWTSTLLDGANIMHACLAGASFDGCSLKEAILYGADMRETRMHDCNLIRASTSWALLPQSGVWSRNLNTGRIDVPRRGE
ncbi:DUF2169 family type VI secretion system accessory protein [Herbaspirillum autotrophicum]|uniref:DUF2169 family type VI secretion system accessory protein n=1 Tax=Herbaspirillum autotrophicum TaxID=180195 RepID=UPI00067A7BF8|nr:pentapeptide repeat-containing protein [Herbaspirillum autotrophicum]